jgi:hypothetical protein
MASVWKLTKNGAVQSGKEKDEDFSIWHEKEKQVFFPTERKISYQTTNPTKLFSSLTIFPFLLLS